jgi:hypothetical protein
MKRNKRMLLPMSLVLLVVMISCSPMESELFQELKESNAFKSFEGANCKIGFQEPRNA